MEGIFRNLRGLDGKERKGSLGKWGLGKEVKVVVEEEEEEKRKIMESAVRKRSGKVVAGLGVMCIWCGGGGGGVHCEKGEGRRSLCARNGEKQRIGCEEQSAAMSFGSDNIPLLASWLMMPSDLEAEPHILDLKRERERERESD
ncbi:hypothetical protein NC652_034226 [Populus alba x Populus x berolinensis]|nr:hypothetical protein NC652_034226 [Populus alba x Populus x berolinensis]